METTGAVIFYWQGLPMYRQILADPTAYASRETPRIWWLVGIALIQVGYWIRYRIAPVLPQVSNSALRHIVLFLAQMVFTLPTAVFSFVFISRKLSPEVPVIAYVLTVAGLFSMFLYMRELQWLGNSLALRRKTRANPRAEAWRIQRRLFMNRNLRKIGMTALCCCAIFAVSIPIAAQTMTKGACRGKDPPGGGRRGRVQELPGTSW